MLLFISCVAFGFLKPFVLYKTLLHDSRWWQAAVIEANLSRTVKDHSRSFRQRSDDSASSEALLQVAQQSLIFCCMKLPSTNLHISCSHHCAELR